MEWGDILANEERQNGYGPEPLPDPDEYVRRTYNIKKKLAKAIKVMAAMSEKKDYDVLNELLEKIIPQEYLK